MKNVILVLALMFSISAMAASPSPTPSPVYSGPSSAIIQDQIALLNAQAKLQADQAAALPAQAAKNATMIQNRITQLNKQLATAQAAGQ